MREAGAVFSAMVEGIRQVLISRASIKNEFRVEQTMLRARDNNALKFSVTDRGRVAALLQPPRPGYKPPLAATREAFDDVRSHEMAVMAGVQTALMGLLKRFEPDRARKAPGAGHARQHRPRGTQGPHLGAVLRHLQRHRGARRRTTSSRCSDGSSPAPTMRRCKSCDTDRSGWIPGTPIALASRPLASLPLVLINATR